MATMNVSLTPEMVLFVNEQVLSGSYVSASEVVREALRLLRQEKDVEAEKLHRLRAAVNVGLEDAKGGRFSTRSAGDIASSVIRNAAIAS